MSRIAKTAAATAMPPQNTAALNIPKTEWKTAFVITKWHATRAPGTSDLALGRCAMLARCSKPCTVCDAQQITPVLMRWLRVRVPELEDKWLIPTSPKIGEKWDTLS